MLVPVSWLKDYVEFDLPTDELAERLTARGVMVEEIKRPKDKISGVVLGLIRSMEKHPNADRLRLCKVEVKDGEILDLITGAPNVKTGDKVPVALEGARLAGGLVIKKSKIRGVESSGMLCSAAELGLDGKDLPLDQREGVLTPETDLPLGADLVEKYLLNDDMLLLETFANRPDMLSIIGVARETASMLGKPLKLPGTTFPEDERPASDYIKVRIKDFDLCSRYMARIISGLKIGPSPEWMSSRLRLAGVRSINNIVDVTNYVMLEYGQPFHAFDYALLKGEAINIRPAKKGEEMITIDESKIPLAPEMLVIADEEGPVALAGVMGGLNSEVNNDTTKILLEIACFQPASIRRTSVNLGMRSESSRRFEKGLDYYGLPAAADRACSLFASMGGRIAKGAVDSAAEPPKTLTIDFRPERASAILGITTGKNQCINILSSLGMKVKEKTSKAGQEILSVDIPSFRPDIIREEDLVEEVARCIGYDKIPTTLPGGVTLIGTQGEEEEFREHIADLMSAAGVVEVITPSLHPEQVFETFDIPREGSMKVLNPLVEEQSYTRNSLLPGMMKALKSNMTPSWGCIKFFEISKIYLEAEPDSFPWEKDIMGIIMASSGNDVDFFTLKGRFELVFQELGMEVDFEPVQLPFFHPGISAEVLLGRKSLGCLGRVHPEVCQKVDINVPVFFGAVDLGHARRLARKKYYEPVPRFPVIERDLAFIIDEGVLCSNITKEIESSGGELLRSVKCFDQYRGKQIPDEKKSLAFRLVFSAPDRTLTDEEVGRSINNIVKNLSGKFDARLREG
ncbi:MAG: phenylalanine--tRNA ligase subunit beta [Chloroflexi bacterium]|nr:phenylalanine--tRNA ligase subunit beta [Chloroflexota bacterium]